MVHPSGTPRLDVKTNHFRPSGLVQKYPERRIDCPDIGSYNRRTAIYTGPNGWRQRLKPAISGHNPQVGIDPTTIRHSRTSFKGVAPGPYARCTGSLLLEVMFGSPDNFRREKLTFHVAPFKSSYQASLGREAFVRFNAIPHYASLTLKMPGPCGIISLKGRLRPRTRLDESGINKLGAT